MLAMQPWFPLQHLAALYVDELASSLISTDQNICKNICYDWSWAYTAVSLKEMNRLCISLSDILGGFFAFILIGK